MQGKGVIKFFAILLAVVCLYQLSFTWVAHKVENDAKVYSKGNPKRKRPISILYLHCRFTRYLATPTSIALTGNLPWAWT
jgi:hypothetical protein